MPNNKHNLFPCLPALLAVLFAATLLSACSAGSAPASESEVRAQIETALGILATGLEREDPLLASQPIDEQFLMGGNVSIRYSDTAWDPNARGISAFRGFFNASFLLLQNISQEFTLTAINVNGAVATCQVTGNFSGVRVDAVPPQNVNASGIDYMTFQRKGGQWLLIRWDEVPPETPPADTGGGGSKCFMQSPVKYPVSRTLHWIGRLLFLGFALVAPSVLPDCDWLAPAIVGFGILILLTIFVEYRMKVSAQRKAMTMEPESEGDTKGSA